MYSANGCWTAGQYYNSALCELAFVPGFTRTPLRCCSRDLKTVEYFYVLDDNDMVNQRMDNIYGNIIRFFM